MNQRGLSRLDLPVLQAFALRAISYRPFWQQFFGDLATFLLRDLYVPNSSAPSMSWKGDTCQDRRGAAAIDD